MKRRYVYIVIFSISVIGLAVVQYQYLRIGLNLAKVQFDRKLAQAGREIRLGLEDENQLSFLVVTAMTERQHFNLTMDQVKEASEYFLNDFLQQELSRSGIDEDFAYRLYTRDSTDYLRAPRGFEEQDELIRYPVELEGYLPAQVGKPVFLEIQFQDLNQYFLSQLNGLTIPSLLFILAIILVVVWILRSFYWQSSVITLTNDFINNLTHELKTPVFSIGVASRILEEDHLEHQKPVIDQIRQQTSRLSRHIDQVLELGSLEAGRRLLQLEPISLYPLVERICKEFSELAKMESFSFQYELEPLEIRVKAEASHLENAVNNLLDNAKKYASDPRILLRLYRSGKKICVSVSDNGIGIDKKDLPNIRKKFFRVSEGNLHKVKGYGLGLTYVDQVVRRHKGSLEIWSEKGKGTTVTIKLPVNNGT